MNAPSSIILPSSTGRRLNPKRLSDAQLAFHEFLAANFFGQPEAAGLLEMAYANYLNPLRDKNKPIAFLVFAGESRTGKTHGARMIPMFVHGSPFALLKINCSEYMDKHSLWNLKGSPRGHLSNQVATDKDYQNVPKTQKHGYAELMNHNLEWSKQGSEAPLTVVLLDEWDKACYEFNLLMLQAMDDGQLTLGSGEIVDFRNTIFVAACNSGMHEVEQEQSGGIGFLKRDRKLEHAEVTSVVDRVIRKQTPPEFRNRLQELGGISVFHSLDRATMMEIVRRDFKGLQDTITKSGFFFTLSPTEAAVEEVLDRALHGGGNLSNVKSLITTEVQIPLGTEAIKGEIHKGDSVTVDVEDAKDPIKPANPEDRINKVFVLTASDPVGLITGAASEGAEAAINAALAGDDKGGKSADRVEDKSAAPVVEPGANKTADGPAATGGIKADVDERPKGSVVIQDFVIVLKSADNMHADLKAGMFSGLSSSPLIKVESEETKYGDTASIGGIVMKVTVTSVKVLAPIEQMFALKRAMPFLEICTVTAPLEL